MYLSVHNAIKTQHLGCISIKHVCLYPEYRSASGLYSQSPPVLLCFHMTVWQLTSRMSSSDLQKDTIALGLIT